MSLLQLGDLIELKYGKSLRKDTRNEGSVPVFGSNGQVDVHSESLVNYPTIIVGRKGSIGEVHLVKVPCWPIDTTYFVESRGKHEFDLEWLYRLLKSLRLQGLNRSAAIPGLNRDDVYRIPVLLPPLKDQIRIAHLLGKVEKLIAQRKQHLQQLDDLLKSVFMEMFGDPVRNEREWETGISTIYAEMVSVGVVVKPASHYVEHGVIALRSLNIKPNCIDLSDLVYFSQESNNGVLSKSRLKANDVVVVRTGKTGTAAVVPAALDGANCIDLIIVRPNLAKIHPQFLTCLLNSERGMALVSSLEVGGIQKHFNVGALKKIPVPLPPLTLQSQFADIVEKVESIKSRYQQSLHDLKILLGALSQQAFKGKLDLSQIKSLTQQIIQCPTDEQTIMPTPHIEGILPIKLPETEFLIAALESRENLQLLLHYWLEAYLAQLGKATFSVERFIAAAQTRLAEYHPDNEFELGANEYEYIKSWVFEVLSAGKLTQVVDEVDNSIHLKVM